MILKAYLEPGVKILLSNSEKITSNEKIGILTNADSCDVSLMEGEKKLHIGLQGAADKQGYVKLTLPHNVLGGNYTVLLDGEVTNNYNASFVSFQRDRFYTPDILGDATIIEIGYDPQVRSIDVIGTSVIPEFGPFCLIMLASVIATVIVLSKFRDGYATHFLFW